VSIYRHKPGIPRASIQKENMNNKVEITNISDSREAKATGAPEGLNSEVRNHNNNQTGGSEIAHEVKQEPISENSVAIPDDPKPFKRIGKQISKMGVRNSDNAGLAAMNVRGFVEGFVVDVNGGLAEEVPAFVPTYDELMRLVKYWTKTDLDIQLFEFRFRATSSTEWRRATFARRRIARIEALIGKDLVEMAQEEAYAEFGKEQDPIVWNILLNGTEEEKKGLQEQMFREMQENAEAEESQVSNSDNEAAASIQARTHGEHGTGEEWSELHEETARTMKTDSAHLEFGQREDGINEHR
jgi:hypothetical protein